MYGEAITPNIHKLALQFGVLDNFFDSGEVSGDGHVWSNAAIGSDYLEKTWQQSYRGEQRTYDFEGVVADGYPLLQKIPDVNEPTSGYLWGDLAAHGKSYYHFGEFISTIFCDEPAAADPQLGPMLGGRPCKKKAIEPGEAIPEDWGGGVNKWPWPIPLMAANTATKPELVGHFATEAPDFNLFVPDQIRVDIFMRHLKGWVADKEQGKDTMPNFVMLRLPNDHTAGTRPGGPTPKSSVADNDLAVGRAVDAISHSPFWDDTAFFILEDDAQDGADHVDAHRSYALVISKYAPHGRGRVGVCRQPFLLDGERGAHDGVAAGAAADEQQRCVRLADFERVYRAGRSAGLRGGLLQPRQQSDLYRQREESPRRRGEHEDGLPPRRSRARAEAERDSVEGCDGLEAGASDADAAQEEGAQGRRRLRQPI